MLAMKTYKKKKEITLTNNIRKKKMYSPYFKALLEHVQEFSTNTL